MIEQIRAMLRWLLDEGHITPLGARQIEKILLGGEGGEDLQPMIPCPPCALLERARERASE